MTGPMTAAGGGGGSGRAPRPADGGERAAILADLERFKREAEAAIADPDAEMCREQVGRIEAELETVGAMRAAASLGLVQSAMDRCNAPDRERHLGRALPLLDEAIRTLRAGGDLSRS